MRASFFLYTATRRDSIGLEGARNANSMLPAGVGVEAARCYSPNRYSFERPFATRDLLPKALRRKLLGHGKHDTNNASL